MSLDAFELASQLADGDSLRFPRRLCHFCQGCPDCEPSLAVSEVPPTPVEQSSMGRFESIGAEIGKLTDDKNAAYGDSFGKCGDFLRLLYPNGISPEQYQDALGIVRVFDKLMRIANRKDAFGESPWRDIGGYAIRGAGGE